MADPTPLLLRARLVMPVGRPAIADGAAVVSGQRITAVGQWRSLRPRFTGKIHDLGEVVLLPGLVNAHCHLDYTHMAGLFPPGPLRWFFRFSQAAGGYICLHVKAEQDGFGG